MLAPHLHSKSPIRHVIYECSTHENDDESSHSNPSSPPQNTSSSSNNVSRVPQNPPHEIHDLNTLLSETITLQTQQRDAHRDGLRLLDFDRHESDKFCGKILEKSVLLSRNGP
ncbi:hypothetical protein Tco_0542921 [Tanacetum coccineum]